MTNLEKLLDEIEKYKEYNLTKLVKERLDKTLNNYLYELDNACNNIRENDSMKIIKELSK